MIPALWDLYAKHVSSYSQNISDLRIIISVISAVSNRVGYLFVCLEFFLPLKNVSLIWSVTIAGEGLQILTYNRHLWPLRIEVYLACNIYCETEHPLIMVISKDLWHSHLLLSFSQWSCHYLNLCRVQSIDKFSTLSLFLS